jgi:hypothetical protein
MMAFVASNKSDAMKLKQLIRRTAGDRAYQHDVLCVPVEARFQVTHVTI